MLASMAAGKASSEQFSPSRQNKQFEGKTILAMSKLRNQGGSRGDLL